MVLPSFGAALLPFVLSSSTASNKSSFRVRSAFSPNSLAYLELSRKEIVMETPADIVYPDGNRQIKSEQEYNEPEERKKKRFVW